MKHFIWLRTTAAANEATARAGGPGPAIARLVARLKPEAFFVSPRKKELFFLCDLNPAELPEVVGACRAFAGQDPEVIPVVEGAEFLSLTQQGACVA